MSANEQFFDDAQMAASFNRQLELYQTFLLLLTTLLTPAQNQKRLNRDGTFFFFFFLPGADALHVYVGAWALCCFTVVLVPKPFRER